MLIRFDIQIRQFPIPAGFMYLRAAAGVRRHQTVFIAHSVAVTVRSGIGRCHAIWIILNGGWFSLTGVGTAL